MSPKKPTALGQQTPDVCEGKQNEVGRKEYTKEHIFLTQMFVVGV